MITPQYNDLRNCSSFIKFFLKNKQNIEKECIQNIENKNFIWYYDPIDNKIEWIGLTELVKNIVTEKFEYILDPIKIICGCVLVPFQGKLMTRKSSFYTKQEIKLSISSTFRDSQKIPKIEMLKFKFFKEKMKKRKKSSKMKFKEISKKTKMSRNKGYSKKKKNKK